jgi:parallel beta-helix repeat protein
MTIGKVSLRGIVVAVLLLCPSLAGATPTVLKSCGKIGSSGSYILAGNLKATGDCLLVMADWITIDLDGFVISGSGTGSAIKPGKAGTQRGITIRNGTIRGFENGIDFASYGTEMRIEQMLVTDCSNYGIGTNEASIVKDNIATQNGIGFYLGSRNVVTGNTATFNSDGFNLGHGCTVIGNTAGVNNRDGFETQNGVTVVNNTAFANKRYGFLRNGGNFVSNTVMLSGVADMYGPANNSANNVPSP